VALPKSPNLVDIDRAALEHARKRRDLRVVAARASVAPHPRGASSAPQVIQAGGKMNQLAYFLKEPPERFALVSLVDDGLQQAASVLDLQFAYQAPQDDRSDVVVHPWVELYEGALTVRLMVDEAMPGSYAHAYRNRAIAELDADRTDSGRDLLRQHVDVLERLFSLQRRMEEVSAALDVVHLLEDPTLQERWEERAALVT
jgi:aryl carrier-like protein